MQSKVEVTPQEPEEFDIGPRPPRTLGQKLKLMLLAVLAG